MDLFVRSSFLQRLHT